MALLDELRAAQARKVAVVECYFVKAKIDAMIALYEAAVMCEPIIQAEAADPKDPECKQYANETWEALKAALDACATKETK